MRAHAYASGTPVKYVSYACPEKVGVPQRALASPATATLEVRTRNATAVRRRTRHSSTSVTSKSPSSDAAGEPAPEALQLQPPCASWGGVGPGSTPVSESPSPSE